VSHPPGCEIGKYLRECIRLFELSGAVGYDSATFIKAFMTGEDSKNIYRQAPAETMSRNWLIFHTLAPEVAIEDLKEIYRHKASD
jgi:hypothetical protein